MSVGRKKVKKVWILWITMLKYVTLLISIHVDMGYTVWLKSGHMLSIRRVSFTSIVFENIQWSKTRNMYICMLFFWCLGY